MIKRFTLILVVLLNQIAFFGQSKTESKVKENSVPVLSKKELDKQSIRKMAGIYRVNFDFAETFSPDTSYQYHERYSEWGVEYVFILEENENLISLQHLLIVNDTMIIKHWRQDWLFENKDIYTYYKDNEWIKSNLTNEQTTGTWTQKVFQVDDSPRYESVGTWNHVDGRHFWEGKNDSPLPRREFTKRSDYNVLNRKSRIEILENGWVLEQDNKKIKRENGIDKLICSEKGIEKFSIGEYVSIPATKWWSVESVYWADVRKEWNKVYESNNHLKISKKIGNKMLWESLFELGTNRCNETTYVLGSASQEISTIIQSYIQK